MTHNTWDATSGNKLPSIELSAVVAHAVWAGLIPKDQQDLPITDMEIRCDFAALMQFVALMYEVKDENEYFEKLLNKNQDAPR
jgi:hypothetical protein